MAPGWLPAFGGVRVPMPRKVIVGKLEEFELSLAPPAGGWKQRGRLRIQASANLGTIRCTARLNGELLAATDDRSEPYANPYPPMLGTPEEMRAWLVLPRQLRDGTNTIVVTVQDAPATKTELMYLDLSIA